ncbi:hypothetical protein BJ170DRAFT_488803 [Xylariales sp. AK1849]|nr:hypothetical protein BJ170DRAFT_488803 [Xylariales sp. AK1849]
MTFSARPTRLQAQQDCIRRYSQSQYRPNFARARKNNWQLGDIAFLRSEASFNDLDYQSLIGTGYLPNKATKHPVIILGLSPDRTHAAITTVSAYSSSEYNNYLAPWKQDAHGLKNRNYFLSFKGSERSNPRDAFLELENGQLMPKPKTSWVFLQQVYVAPITTLGTFDKTPTRLRMTQESLSDLHGHMENKTRGYNAIKDHLKLYASPATPASTVKARGPTTIPSEPARSAIQAPLNLPPARTPALSYRATALSKNVQPKPVKNTKTAYRTSSTPTRNFDDPWRHLGLPQQIPVH